MFNIHAYRYYLCGNYIKTEDNPPPKFFPCCLQIQYLSFCNDSEQNSKMFMHLYLQEMRFFCQIECITKKSANVPAKQWKKGDVYMYTRTIKLTHFISGCIVNFPKQ